jgi:hypothetical protein
MRSKPEADSEKKKEKKEDLDSALDNQENKQAQVVVDLGDGIRLRLTLEVLPKQKGRMDIDPSQDLHITVSPKEVESPKTRAGLGNWFQSTAHWIKSKLQPWPYSLAGTLFIGALLVYLITRLIGLSDYPIFFFTDEAVQTNLAADFIRDNFRHEGVLFPTYFKNVYQYNLSTSVYAQVIPYLLFGKSIFVTRAVTVFISLLAAWAVGMTLREIFQIPYWWAATFLLSITPAWFLHSRTAFETALMVSFYAGFLYFYLLYRYKSPNNLYWAVVFGALAFYSYSPGQVVMALSAILLFISDIRFHWQNRSTILKGLSLILLLALPYIRFQLSHGQSSLEHLRLLDSYWLKPISFSEKLEHYFKEYFFGLSPVYWFINNTRDMERHLMGGLGNIEVIALPFAVIGLLWTLVKIRQPASRALLIALIAAPSGAAMVQIGITRTLVFVIPATLFTAIGLSWTLEKLEKRWSARRLFTLILFFFLVISNIYLMRNALVNGPTWSDEYGLAGMQYGGKQLFSEIERYTKEHPETKLIVSPTWANGPDVIARFFFDDPMPFEFGGIDPILHSVYSLDTDLVMVVTPEEYQQLEESKKFSKIEVERTLPYPDGRTGFYFVRLAYVTDIENIIEQEAEKRRELVEGAVSINGETAIVRHSFLDMGEIDQLFDGDLYTVTRTWEANPYIIEITYDEPRDVGGVSLVIGSAHISIKIELYQDLSQEAIIYTKEAQGIIDDPWVRMSFDSVENVKTLKIFVDDLTTSEPGNVHVWEVEIE